MVKTFLVSLIIMLSFVTNAIAESSCMCVAEIESHLSHEEDKQTESTEQEEQHCSHVCSQCHFVALSLPVYIFEAVAPSHKVIYPAVVESSRYISKILYRPPIA